MRKPTTLEDYLEDIQESIRRIQKYTKAIDFAEFEKDEMRQDAVIRAFEVLGEATKKITEDFRKKHPEIPWNKMAGMRDKLIHDYWGVNIERVWDTATEDIPPLRNLIKDLL